MAERGLFIVKQTGVILGMSASICRQLAAGYLGVSAKTSAAWSLRHLSSNSRAPSSPAPAAAGLSLCGIQTGFADDLLGSRQYSTGPKANAKESKAATPKKAKTTGYSMFLKDAWTEIKDKGGVSLPLLLPTSANTIEWNDYERVNGEGTEGCLGIAGGA